MKKVIGCMLPNAAEIREIVDRLKPQNMEVMYIPDGGEERQVLLRRIDYLIFFSGRLERKDLVECANLQFIQLLTAGIDAIDIPTVKDLNIVIADNNGANATAVAEHTVLLILAALKKLLVLHSNVISFKWQGPPPFIKDLIELKGKTVGIVGFGRIGQKVAQRLNGFETNLQYCDVRDIEIPEPISIKRVSHEVLFKTSDIVTLHVPLTRETFHMINEQALSLMKSGVVIINTSRGQIVDEKALIDAMKIGKVESIGLDVFEDEPLRTRDLFGLPNIVLTPHRAGSTIENWDLRLRLALENIQVFDQGKQPVGII